MLDYGYRSKCCYAPIRLGTKKIKNSKIKIKIWVCCKCHKRDVDLVQYTKDGDLGSSQNLKKWVPFVPDDTDFSPEIEEDS